MYTFGTSRQISRYNLYEPDGTNSARRLYSGSKVTLISAFLSSVSRSPPFSPISNAKPRYTGISFDGVRGPKIYTGENAPRRETINKFQSHRTEEIRSQ